MPDWLAAPAARIVAGLVFAGLVIGAAFWLVHSLTSGKAAKVEARLNANQAGAAIESGADAANAIGKLGEKASQIDEEVRHGTDEIRNAPDAGAGDAAARDSLCAISTDLCAKDAVQPAGARKPSQAHP